MKVARLVLPKVGGEKPIGVYINGETGAKERRSSSIEERGLPHSAEKRGSAIDGLQGKVKHRYQPYLLPVKGGFRKEYLSHSA